METLDEQQRCRECGCTDLGACEGEDGLPCAWVEDDLCTACAGLTLETFALRLTLLDHMVRLADAAASATFLGETPVEWGLVARWPDGRVNATSKIGLSAAAFQRLLDEAAQRVGEGPTPVGIT